MEILLKAREDSLQSTVSSPISVLPTDGGKLVSKTDGHEPTLAIIISSICGTIAILTIAFAVACVKYNRGKRNRFTESKLSSDTHKPQNETHKNNTRGTNETDTACQNNQSTQYSYQSSQVCRENPYLQMNKRPAIQDKIMLEGKDTYSYVKMTRCQIGDLDDAYQSVGDWVTTVVIDQIHQSTDEEFSTSPVAKTGEFFLQLIKVHSVNVGNDVPLQSNIESTNVNNDHIYCNTTI